MNLEQLQEICLQFKGTTEGIKWEEHLCFMVGEKIFCISGMDEACHVAIKVSEEDFDELTEREGIIQAAHFAKRQWIGIQQWHALKPKEWETYLQKSYELVKMKLTKKQQQEIDSNC